MNNGHILGCQHVAHGGQLRVVQRAGVEEVGGLFVAEAGFLSPQQNVAQVGEAVAVRAHHLAQGVVHLAVAHLIKREVDAHFIALGHPVGQVLFGGGESQLVAPHADDDAVERGPVGGRAAGYVAKQRGIFAHLKQVQALLPGGPLQLQYHLAAEANVFLRDGDGVPGEAALLPLLYAGLGVFELELHQVFLLLQLHEGLHLAQLFFDGVGVDGGESGGGIGQKKAGWVRC